MIPCLFSSVSSTRLYFASLRLYAFATLLLIVLLYLFVYVFQLDSSHLEHSL